jgi:hypothetical protein
MEELNRQLAPKTLWFSGSAEYFDHTGKVSARVLAERLDQQHQLSIPQRTVGHYMQKLGLTQVKESLRESLQALKNSRA